MSYSRHYSDRVYYSGTKVVSYPASENGGTKVVHYDGSVPVNVTINVDTNPFDVSIDNTKASLNIVAGALSAAEAAQIAQIAKSGEEISDAAIGGFLRVLSSELSSQMSESSSTMKSYVGLLMEESRQVEHIHQQMEDDYRAIKERYLRIFNALDKELVRRIQELDRPAFQVHNNAAQGTIVQPFVGTAAKILVHSTEIDEMALKLQCAMTKHGVSSSLGTLGDVCTYISEYGFAVEAILTDQGGEGDVYRPVVYTLQEDLDTQNQRIVVHESDMGATVKSSVIRNVASASESDWQQLPGSTREAVDAYFMEMVENYHAAQLEGDQSDEKRERVSKMIVELYQQSQPKTMYSHE